MYALKIYNKLKDKYFVEIYYSPYLLKKRVNLWKYSKILEYVSVIKN